MAKFRDKECVIISADKQHPISSKICSDGSLSQMGISGEGFQREVGVRRTTQQKDGKYQFCWELSLYQHAGGRHVVPLGCSRPGDKEAPKKVKQFARAFHDLALQGYDPSEDRSGRMGGIPRGQLWHKVMLPALCAGHDEKTIQKHLKDWGAWGDLPATGDATAGLGGLRGKKSKSKAKRKKARR